MKEKILDNIPIHYWINNTKSKETIMFLHPGFANHACFDLQLEHFKDKYQVIAMDILGHGKSIGKGSIVDTAEFIKEIMAKENINKIHLVGVSLGAVLIQDFANKYPNKVASLCCIGGYDINNFDKSIQKENSREQLKLILKAIFSIKAFAKANKKISAYTEEAQDRFYEMVLGFRKSSLKQFASLNGVINKYQIEKREYPLMIGVGEYDHNMAIKAAKMWSETEPNCKYIIFKNAGHIVNMDIPDEFNHTLEDFLQNKLIGVVE